MRAYERLLQYVKFHTTSSEETHTHPSTERQFALAKYLEQEMRALGLQNVLLDEHCYVYGTLPATPGHEAAPGLGFIAHMDTSDEASGENVQPIVHPNYNGEDVTLPTGVTLDTVRFPFLKGMKGQTLITSDGSTLLGADDKAGIAEILTMAERLQAEKIPHGKICIAFTPDEEIGEGSDFFDLERFGAAYAYTVDGGDVGGLEYENFNAASAVVTVRGFSVHPGEAKDVMVNAQQVAMDYHQSLPQQDRPEHTAGHEGFYHLTSMMGQVSLAKLGYIVRDHDLQKFEQRKQTMQALAEKFNRQYGPDTVTVQLSDTYYNMLEKIRPHWHLIENARKAIQKAGLTPVEEPVRGGTDGAMLSFKGLPCPNLGTGGFNFHGVCECITAEKMDKAVEILLGLAEIYKG